ncbi:MAG TPA: hypothetical protein VMG80_02650 [Solirubrobacteraceae bacterium]|nr:hypothetical protein [Solirubrobacteraceae bacterium]
MAGGNRAKGRPHGRGRGRGRSRKRRPAQGAATVLDPPAAAAPGGQPAGATAQRGQATAKDKKNGGTRARANGVLEGTRPAGERPPAPWHPLPLSELLILVGGVGAVIGLTRLGQGGIASGGPALFAGLGAVAVGTLEIAWREHRSGYRSHALLLALLPVVVFHTVAILGLAAFTNVPRIVNFALLVLDAAIFAVLFKLLRAGFLDARARVVARG